MGGRRAQTRRRRTCSRRARAHQAGREGRTVAHQRHPVHGGDGLTRDRARPQALACCGHRLRDVARGAARVAHELHGRDSRGAPASWPAGVGRQRSAAARGLGDHRVTPMVRQGAGRLLAALRASGAWRQPRSARLRRVDRRDRDQCGHGQSARPHRARRDRLERQLPRPAHSVRARLPGDRGRRAREHLRAACGAHGEPDRCPTACRRFSPGKGASTPAS